MQIQLCEDDSAFHGGIPQLVVLVVKFDDGKTKRIPYPAEKTISALYQDLYAIAPGASEASTVALEPLAIEEQPKPVSEPVKASESPLNANKGQSTAVPDKSNVIEKEDIITLIKLNPRDLQFSGMQSPLVVGMDYRIIEIFGPRIPIKGELKQIVQGYDVIDDSAPTPERMRVYPDEVQLKAKRVLKGIDKTFAVEEILSCPSCQAKNSLKLVNESFVGNCSACHVEISIARTISSCMTPACKKEGVKVSCFDVGGKFEGTCGKCKSKIEVPYV